MYRSIRTLGTLALTGAAVACSTSTGLSNAGKGTVKFQTASKAGPAPAPSHRMGASGASFNMIAVPDTLSLGANVLVITQAELVLKRIELEKVQAQNCEAAFDSSECDELNVGPLLLDLPLTPGAVQSFSIAADTGTFAKFQLHIHKVSGNDPADQAFLAAHPGMDGVSIRVTGTYNGVAFTYTTDLDAEQEMDLVPPVTVAGGGTVGLTLFADVNTWFLDVAKTGLVDPATALVGLPNEVLVESNIKASLKSFEDNNEDGHSDH